MVKTYCMVFHVAFLFGLMSTACEPPDIANHDCENESNVVGASSLVIRLRPEQGAEAVGLLREGDSVRACPTGDEYEIANVKGRWFALEDGRGFVFGGFLARPETEIVGTGQGRVFSLFRHPNTVRAYIINEAGKRPCKLEYEAGGGIYYSGSADFKYILISPGTSAIRSIWIMQVSTCEMLVRTVGLPQAREWQGYKFRFEKSEWTDAVCIMTEFEFNDGSLTETGRVHNAGRASEC